MMEESPKTGQEGWRDEPPGAHLLILAGRHVILLVTMFPEEMCAVRPTCNEVLEVVYTDPYKMPDLVDYDRLERRRI